MDLAELEARAQALVDMANFPAAMYYREQILAVNTLLAELVEQDVDACRGRLVADFWAPTINRLGRGSVGIVAGPPLHQRQGGEQMADEGVVVFGRGRLE